MCGATHCKMYTVYLLNVFLMTDNNADCPPLKHHKRQVSPFYLLSAIGLLTYYYTGLVNNMQASMCLPLPQKTLI